jgi:hypothetical protein
MEENKSFDSLIAGLIIGILSIALNYIFLLNLNRLLFHFTEKDYLQPPKLQLIILGINMILFRYLMVTWNKPRTGKGLLLLIFITTGWYVYNNKPLLR